MTCSFEGLDKIVFALFICQIVLIVSTDWCCIYNGNAVLRRGRVQRDV